jgi:hypothetical protein
VLTVKCAIVVIDVCRTDDPIIAGHVFDAPNLVVSYERAQACRLDVCKPAAMERQWLAKDIVEKAVGFITTS